MDIGTTVVAIDVGGVQGGVDLTTGSINLARVFDVDVELLKKRCEAAQLWQLYEIGTLSTPDVLSFLRNEFGGGATDSQLLLAIESVVLPQFPDTLNLVQRLKRAGCQLVLLSNTNPTHWAKVLREYESVGYFGVLCASHEMGCAKPDPAAYANVERLASEAGMCVRNVIFFDDTPAYVEGARKVGWHAHLFTDAFQAERDLADYGIIL